MKKIEALKDKDSDIRAEAAEKLGEAGDKTAVPALIETLKDKDIWVRITAAEALGKIGIKSSVSALIKALTDINSSVRCSASAALGEIGSRSALESLRHVAKNDRNMRVKKAAKETIKKIEAKIDL